MSSSVYATGRCASVSTLECIQSGKVKDLTKLSEMIDGRNPIATCCKPVAPGSCKNQDGDWKKEFCYAQGKDFKESNTITSDGNNCCTERPDAFKCRDLDWGQCWGIDEFGTPVEMAKAPDPKYGYALRDENPYLLCSNGEDEDEDCPDSGTYFPDKCKTSFDGDCTQVKVCDKAPDVNVKGQCRAWDTSWQEQYNTLEKTYKDNMSACCYSFDDPDAQPPVTLKCTGNLYVGDIGGPQKDVILWENIKRFVGSDGDYDCKDPEFDVDDPTSCICTNCSAGSTFFKENKDKDNFFRVREEVDGPGCSPIGEDCEQDVYCYGESKEGGTIIRVERGTDGNINTDGSFYLKDAIMPSGMVCTAYSEDVSEDGTAECVEMVDANTEQLTVEDLDKDQSCIPGKCGEDGKMDLGCDSDSASTLDPGKATKDALDSMGFDQVCKQEASTQSASFAASTKASCPFGSVGAQVSGTAMNNQMSQSGCGVFSATITNVQNLQQSRSCIEQNISNTSTVNVNANASIKIGSFPLTESEKIAYKEMNDKLMDNQTAIILASLQSDLTYEDVEMLNRMFEANEKQIQSWNKIYGRDVNIINSTVTSTVSINLKKINANNINLATQIENSFKASTANAAEATLKQTLGVNALSPNAKQLINQNITNNNVQITKVLTNVMNKSVTSTSGGNVIEILAHGPVLIKDSVITATTALEIQQEDLNTMSQFIGQSISADIINDVSSKNGMDTTSKGLNDLIDALGAANAAAIRANAEGVGGDWILYLIGGIMLIVLIMGGVGMSGGNKGNAQQGMQLFQQGKRMLKK